MTPLQIMGQHFWALIPALTAIVLALITKEVYISLFLGIFVGAMINAGGNPIEALKVLFETMANAMGPDTEVTESGDIAVTGAGNAGIFIFICLLGILVALMSKAGGAKAFGRWVHTHIKSRRGALLATTGLGCMMFMDDYFNRLTVGSIMAPVNDQFRISRAKSTFIVGSISVSICILVPVSSWASAISSNIAEAHLEISAFNTYVQTIGANFYPIFLLLFLFATSILGINMFGMLKHERTAIETGDLLCGLTPSRSDEEIESNPRGTLWDLILPIAVLVASCCVFLLIKKNGEAIFDTNTALCMGACIALMFCLVLYLPRKLMTLKDYTGCFGTGFKSIADVILILALAWTLTGICHSLSLNEFVGAFAECLGNFKSLLPAIFFLAAMGCAFATGTSWGTFGIMVPIVAPMGMAIGYDLMVLTISAVLSGAVFGDQVSPISDATILSAAACRSNHLGYVKAQLPNALLIAAIAFVCFLVSGLSGRIWLGWIVGIVLFAALITTAYFIQKKNGTLAGDLYKKAMAQEQPDILSEEN